MVKRKSRVPREDSVSSESKTTETYVGVLGVSEWVRLCRSLGLDRVFLELDNGRAQICSSVPFGA